MSSPSLPSQLTTAICAFSTATTGISLIIAWSSFFHRGWKFAQYESISALCSNCHEEHLLLALPVDPYKTHSCPSKSCRPLKNENGIPAWKRSRAQMGAVHTIWSSVGAIYSTVDLFRQPSRTLLALRLLLDIVFAPVKVVNLGNGISTLLTAGSGHVPRACRNVCLHSCTLTTVEPQVRQQDERLWYRLRANLDIASLIVTPIIVVPELVAVILSLLRIKTDPVLPYLSFLIGIAPLGIYLMSKIEGGSVSGAAMASSRGQTQNIPAAHAGLVRRMGQTFDDGREDMATPFLWGTGTIISAITYIVVLGLHWQEREASIQTREEAWIQFGEGVFGVGG